VIVRDVHTWLRSLEFHPYEKTRTTLSLPPGSYTDEEIEAFDSILQPYNDENEDTHLNRYRDTVVIGRAREEGSV